MWTLKETPTIEKAPSLQMKATFVFTDGTDEETVSATYSTVKEVKQSARDLINRLNERDAAIAETVAGTFSIEEKVVDRTPTQVEQKQAQYDQVLADYREMKELHEIDSTIVSANDLSNKANEVKNARTELANAKRNA